MRVQMSKVVGIIISVVVAYCLSGCVSMVPKYPQHTSIQDGIALPIDGLWQNEGSLPQRIRKGKLYITKETSSGIPPGSLMARSIEQTAPGEYRCLKESYNPNTGILDYGRGTIRVLSSTSIEVQALPNPRTGLGKTSPYTLRLISLDDESAYMRDLGIMLGHKQEEIPKKDPTLCTGLVTYGDRPAKVADNIVFPPGSEQHKQLGTCILSLAPVMLMSQDGASIGPGADEANIVNDAQELLTAGADPNAVKIHGFAAPRKEVGQFTTTYTSGNPGNVVPASHEGVTLLQFCTANGFTACAELLEKNGAK